MKKLAIATAVLAAGVLAYAQQDMTMNAAYVRVVHASPDAPNVDVYLDNKRTVANAPFKAVTDFGDVPAGKHTVKVTAAGNPNQVVFQADVDLQAGTYYTVAAVGYLRSIKPKIFTSNGMNMMGMTGSMMDRSKASITVYHLAPNGPRVDALAVDMNNAKVVNALGYGNKVTVMVNPMGVNLNVTPAGQPDTVVKNISGVSVAGGKSYSIFAVGLVGATGKTAFDTLVKEDTAVMGSMAGTTTATGTR